MLLDLGILAAFAVARRFDAVSARESGIAAWGFQKDSSVPLAGCFVLTRLSDGSPAMTYTPKTRAAVIAGLESQGWTTNEVLGPAVTTISKHGALGVPALVGMRAATLAGMNVYVDADLALKVGGARTVPQNPCYVAVSTGIGIAPAISPDDDDEVAQSGRSVLESLDMSFPGARYVLFAKAGEVF